MNIAYATKFYDSVERLANLELAGTVWQTIALIAKGNDNLPGLHVEPIHGKLSNLRSCRITGDYRLIFAKFGDAAIMLHVDHHDDAYAWARRTRCNINPQTHLPQIYQIEETAAPPAHWSAPAQSGDSGSAFPPAGDRPFPFRNWPPDSSLLRLGIPEEQLPTVRAVENTDDLIARKERGLFPDAVWETLVTLLDEPSALPKLLEDADAEAARLAALGPDASVETLVQASDSARASIFLSGDDTLNARRSGNLDAWRVFLLPEQRKIAERHFNGPVFATGGAGTGKTVVALHRVKWLLEHVFDDPAQRILLASYSKTLADSLSELLGRLCSPQQLKRVDVCTLDAAASRFLRTACNRSVEIDYTAEAPSRARAWMKTARGELLAQKPALENFAPDFLLEEYEEVVEAFDLRRECDYLRVSRAGRRKTLSRDDRSALWQVFVRFRALAGSYPCIRRNEAMNRAVRCLLEGTPSPYAAAVVDEVQDLGAAALRLLAAFTGNSAASSRPDSLLLVGDANQRIFGRPVKLSRCGIDVRGRSKRLKMNYRCTERIRKRAESVLRGVTVADLDDGPVSRTGLSVVLGEAPDETRADAPEAIPPLIARTLLRWKDADGPNRRWRDYAVLVSTNAEAQQYVRLLKDKWCPAVLVAANTRPDPDADAIRVLTMHRAKGLEFVGVAIVLQADKWPARPRDFANLSEIEKGEVLIQAKSLLYVAMTRAMSRLLLTGSPPVPPELPPP